jgi:hypothetical protein
MFVRFSNQEDLDTYQPTATNTAGTFRLDTGNEIRAAIQGKDYIFVVTDLGAYVIQYVGPPYTFSVRQVGTNCGCIGQNAISYANGAVWWMSGEGGFFVYDGTVKALPSLVEDFVFLNTGTGNLGLNYSSSRTTYQDQGVFTLPYATKYDDSNTPVFPEILGITSKYGASIYYAHETGTDQINSTGTTSINAFILSGDFEITNNNNIADFTGDGEYIMSVKRFIPDYKYLSGNSKITLYLNDYPSETAVSSSLGPFTITTTTDKIDTRARARFVAIQIANDAVGETWRYGTLRLDAKPDGRR